MIDLEAVFTRLVCGFSSIILTVTRQKSVGILVCRNTRVCQGFLAKHDGKYASRRTAKALSRSSVLKMCVVANLAASLYMVVLLLSLYQRLLNLSLGKQYYRLHMERADSKSGITFW